MTLYKQKPYRKLGSEWENPRQLESFIDKSFLKEVGLELNLDNFFLIYFLFFYVWLRSVFVAACRLFSSCGERGLLFIAERGLLIGWLLLLQSTDSRRAGFSSCGIRAQQLWLAGSRVQAQQLWRTGLVAPQHVGSSRSRTRTHVPCIGRQILNHCATREARQFFFFLENEDKQKNLTHRDKSIK